MKFEDSVLQKEWDTSKEQSCIEMGGGTETPSDAALGALLEDSEPVDDDAERREQRLGSRLARLDALNVAGMLAAATEAAGAGAALAERLDAGLGAAAALAARLRRYDELARHAPAAPHARSDAARADANARLLLAELDAVYEWLDAPALRDLDSLAEVSLTQAEGRARALAAASALRAALRAEARAPAARRRLGAVRERGRRLARARDALAAALARHLNNALIHLGNEAAAEAGRARRHHTELAPYAPFMRWLKDMDEKAFDALAKVYTSAWSRVYEREVRAACDAARAAAPDRADEALDDVLTLVETLCNAEQDFCTQFFFLDIDVKGEGSDGERSERSDGGEARGRVGADSRRFMGELFPALEQELVALVAQRERAAAYGAMRALACVGRRVLGAGAGEARWARAALAGAAVAAKRGADRAVQERVGALADSVKAAARRPKCGVLACIGELEALSGACEAIFAPSGRRADLDRWYLALASAIMHTIQHAEHPRTPRAVVHMENYHRLHGVLSALRVGALEALRREARARYADALRSYVTQYFGRPLEKLTQFFEVSGRAGGGEAVGAERERVGVAGRGGGGGGRRARGRGVLPRRVQQARAAAAAGAVPGGRGAQVAAPPVPHRGEAPQRGGRPAAGRVARHAGGVHRPARGAAGAHRGVLPGGGAGAAAHHAAHPRRLLRHRTRTLTAHTATACSSHYTHCYDYETLSKY